MFHGRAFSSVADPTGSDGILVWRKASARLRVSRACRRWFGLRPPCLARGVGTVLERRAGLNLSRGTRCPAQDLWRGTGGPRSGPVVSPLPPASANPWAEAPGPVGSGARPAISPGGLSRVRVGGRGAGGKPSLSPGGAATCPVNYNLFEKDKGTGK